MSADRILSRVLLTSVGVIIPLLKIMVSVPLFDKYWEQYCPFAVFMNFDTVVDRETTGSSMLVILDCNATN